MSLAQEKRCAFNRLRSTLSKWNCNEEPVVAILNKLERDQITSWGVDLVDELVEWVIQHRNRDIAERTANITEYLEPAPLLPLC